MKTAREEVMDYMIPKLIEMAKNVEGQTIEDQQQAGQKLEELVSMHPRFKELLRSDLIEILAEVQRLIEKELGINPDKSNLN